MTVISVKNLSKAYKQYTHKGWRLAEWLTPGNKTFHQLHWILRDVNFDIEAGEAVGIIGKNGAGKSTLLKLITGTSKPNSGSITTRGSVAALLELGIGFHPDFTGRQNIYMAGQLLGHNNATMDACMKDILAFAEIGEYIDLPLRTYSSGMQVRLAFSVATVIRPDILIVDEALSVGDAYFQHRCMKRIREFKKLGTTILFVSHDASTVKNLCDRAILIDQGVIAKEGRPDYVLDYYNALIAEQKKESYINEQQNFQPEIRGSQPSSVISVRSGNNQATIQDIAILQNGTPAAVVRTGQSVTIRVRYTVHQANLDVTLGITIKDRLGNAIFGTNTFHLGETHLFENGNEICIANFHIDEFNVGVGHYSISAALHAEDTHLHNNYDWWDQALVFHVVLGNQPQFAGVCYLPIRYELETTA